MLLVWVMKNFFKSLLNLFNFKENTIHMTISELKAFNIREEKIEKERRFRAYISKINQRHNKIRKKDMNSQRKAS